MPLHGKKRISGSDWERRLCIVYRIGVYYEVLESPGRKLNQSCWESYTTSHKNRFMGLHTCGMKVWSLFFYMFIAIFCMKSTPIHGIHLLMIFLQAYILSLRKAHKFVFPLTRTYSSLKSYTFKLHRIVCWI